MDRPEREEPKPKPTGWFSLLLAAGVGILILLGLIMLSGGYLGLVIFVGGGVFALAAFHYLVWGWWLSEKLYREEAEAERHSAELAQQRAQLPAAPNVAATHIWLIFWGVVVTMFSIKINGVDLLPAAGYGLIAWGSYGLRGESVHFAAAAALASIIVAIRLAGLVAAFPAQTVGSREVVFLWALIYSILACGVVWEMLGGVRDIALVRSRPDLATKASHRRIAYAAVMIGCVLAAKLFLYDHESLPVYVVLVGGLIVGVMVLHLIYRVQCELA